jgi:hypothetical protein
MELVECKDDQHPNFLLFSDILTGLQCKWAKLKAHAAHWAEEVQLPVEEMCHVITFLNWKAQWWKQQGNACSGQFPADIAQKGGC